MVRIWHEPTTRRPLPLRAHYPPSHGRAQEPFVGNSGTCFGTRRMSGTKSKSFTILLVEDNAGDVDLFLRTVEHELPRHEDR